MTLVVDEDGMRAESTIYAADVPNPHPPAPEVSTLDRIRARKVIRVGFVEDNLPWTYRASDGRLLGFDIDMAHRLAIDLDVGLEFVPVTRDGIESALKEGLIDLAMSGIKGSIQRAERLGLSSPYIDVHLALIVPDFRARALSTYAGLRAQERLFIGLADENEFARLLPRRFPNVTVVKIDNKIDFFENRLPDVDALLTGAENGAAWTLRYPRFRVVRPTRHQVTLPLVYLHAGTDEAFDEFLEHWVDVKRRDGTVEDFYDYWILGRGAQTTGPRWSIIRDVLGWVD